MNPVSQLDREWSSLGNDSAAEAFGRWQRREPALRRFASPAALLTFLRDAQAGEGDAQLRALLALAGEDPLAGRLVLQALLPALETLSRRIAHPHARRRELRELLLFFAWEAICADPPPLSSRRVAAHLLVRVLDDTARELRAQRSPGKPGPSRLRLLPAAEGTPAGGLPAARPGRQERAEAKGVARASSALAAARAAQASAGRGTR